MWVVIGLIANKVEAWDSRSYFSIGLPILFAASGVAGYLEPERPWRWGIMVFIGQPIALLLQNMGNEALAFVGLFFFLFFIVLAIGCAYVGRFIRRSTGR